MPEPTTICTLGLGFLYVSFCYTGAKTHIRYMNWKNRRSYESKHKNLLKDRNKENKTKRRMLEKEIDKICNTSISYCGRKDTPDCKRVCAYSKRK